MSRAPERSGRVSPDPMGGSGISALLLAGGRSRRLGIDKPFVEIGGRTLLERALAATGSIADVVLSVRDSGPFRETLEGLGWSATAGSASAKATDDGVADATLVRGERRVRILPDPEPDAGPLAALGGGLAAARGGLVAVLSVDIPFVTAALVGHLLDALADAPGADACVPVVGGHPQWLCAAYRARLAPEALWRAARPAGDPSIRGLLDGREWLALDETELAVCGDPGVLTRDIDTPADLAWARSMVEGTGGVGG